MASVYQTKVVTTKDKLINKSNFPLFYLQSPQPQFSFLCLFSCLF